MENIIINDTYRRIRMDSGAASFMKGNDIFVNDHEDGTVSITGRAVVSVRMTLEQYNTFMASGVVQLAGGVNNG